jgi:hypothetical protein
LKQAQSLGSPYADLIWLEFFQIRIYFFWKCVMEPGRIKNSLKSAAKTIVVIYIKCIECLFIKKIIVCCENINPRKVFKIA